jgi:Glycosidases
LVVKSVIYQLLVRAFGCRECLPGGSFSINGSGKFNDIDDRVLSHIKSLSADTVWYTGVISHATKTHFDGIRDCSPAIVKGEAGSPYAIRNWFDVDPALAVDPEKRMEEFDDLVARTHKAGLKVLIDFVPNHVYREYEGFFTDENFFIFEGPLQLPDGLSGYVENPAKATGNDRFDRFPDRNDWYDTVKLNYGVRSTREKMIEVLRFWARRGVDGFRCDMVEMVPVDFFVEAIAALRAEFPGLRFVAEVYDPGNYQRYKDAGFDLLYDKCGYYDAIRNVVCNGRSAASLTWEWQRLGALQGSMLNFLENHDEQRVASDFYAGDGRRALAALSVSLLFNNASFMLYSGQEFGERGMDAEGFSGVDGRTSIYDYCCIPSIARWLSGQSSCEEKIIHEAYETILRTAASIPAFSKGGTYDLMYVNPSSDHFNPQHQFVWLRGYEGDLYIVAANFNDSEAEIEVNIPEEAFRFFGRESSSHTHRMSISSCNYLIDRI